MMAAEGHPAAEQRQRTRHQVAIRQAEAEEVSEDAEGAEKVLCSDTECDSGGPVEGCGGEKTPGGKEPTFSDGGNRSSWNFEKLLLQI